MTEQLTDFPKIYCPFIRQTFQVKKDDYRKKGNQFQLREPEVYLVVNRVNPGYEWVFDDEDTIAVEKLDGTNIKIKTEKGRLVALQNRKNQIDPLQIIRGQVHLLESVINSAVKSWVQPDGEQAGECIGPKLQGNPLKLDRHLWYPFDRAISTLSYRSFHEHEKTFENLSSWFKDFLFSRLFTKMASKTGSQEKVFAEGVVFYNLKRRAQEKTWRAKLRRDMFHWFYDGIEIYDYTEEGRDETEDQEKFL